MKIIIAGAVALYAAGVLWAAADAKPVNDPNVAPAGCTITHSWEDGSRIAECADGTNWHYDPDGLGPFCPVTSKRFGESGWHTQAKTTHAQKACKREIRKEPTS